MSDEMSEDRSDDVTTEPSRDGQAMSDDASDDTAVIRPVGDDNESNDDLAALLRKREHAKPNRWTWALVGLLVLAVGFIGGAFVGKRAGDSGGGSLPEFAAAARASGGFPSGSMPSGFPGAGGQSGSTDDTDSSTTTDGTTDGSGTAPGAGFGGGFGGMTVGTVTSVGDGSLVITDMSGNEVTVSVGTDTSITKQADVSLADLAVGSTVVVRGETADDGSVTAQSISEGSGGFPGGGIPSGMGSGGMGSAPGGQGAPGSTDGTTEGTDQ